MVPLAGTVSNHLVFASKVAVVRAIQADAEILERLELLGGRPADVTGHFMRRSGAKHFARSGVPLAKIQWLGRWGSAAVLAYVEEAAEEAPGADDGPPGESPGTGWEHIRTELAQVIREGGRAALDNRSGLPPSIVEFLASVRSELCDVSSLVRELDALVRPTLVLNRKTGVVHRIVRTERLDPELWSTCCGWRWSRSAVARPIGQDDVEQAGDLWAECPRCHGVQMG